MCTCSVAGFHLHTRKVFRIGTVRYNWPMSAHASQAFSIAHCTDSEDLPHAPPFTVTSHYFVIYHPININLCCRHTSTQCSCSKSFSNPWAFIPSSVFVHSCHFNELFGNLHRVSIKTAQMY